MEIEKLIERLQNWDGIKPDREIDCAIEGLKALQAENDRLQAELEKEEAARKKQADILYELRGQKYEQTTAIDQLQAENDRLRRERDAAVKDISDLIDEVEEIRRGYGIDDSDADKALADMCGNYCENEGDGCYIEGEKIPLRKFQVARPAEGGMSVSDTKKPVFNADAAEEYFSDLLVFYRNTANDIFRKDNEGRHASNQTYSAEYQKYVGMQMAMREVLEYFSKFEL